MKALNLFSIVLFVLFFSACTTEDETSDFDTVVVENPEYSALQDEEEPPIQLELVDEFIFDEDFELLVGTTWFLTTDENGNIYFYDYELKRLVSLNSEGELRWETGEEGRGPGDFESVFHQFLYDGKLYISNISGTRLDIYDLDGTYLSTQTMPKELSGSILGISPENELVVQTPYWENIGVNISVADYSNSLKTLRTFPIKQMEDRELDLRASISSGIKYRDAQIVSGYFGDYEIHYYNLQGNLVKKVTRDFDRITPPGITPDQVRSFGSVSPPVFFPDGHYAVKATWADNISDPDQYVLSGSQKEVIFKGTFDFFSPEDELIYSFEFDGFSSEFGNLAHVDAEGFAYFTTSTPVPTIRKYKVRFPE